MLKRKWQNLSIFKKYFSTPFCKKGLGQPAKSSLMSGFKDGRRSYRSRLFTVHCVHPTGNLKPNLKASPSLFTHAKSTVNPST